MIHLWVLVVFFLSEVNLLKNGCRLRWADSKNFVYRRSIVSRLFLGRIWDRDRRLGTRASGDQDKLQLTRVGDVAQNCSKFRHQFGGTKNIVKCKGRMVIYDGI